MESTAGGLAAGLLLLAGTEARKLGGGHVAIHWKHMRVTLWCSLYCSASGHARHLERNGLQTGRATVVKDFNFLFR